MKVRIFVISFTILYEFNYPIFERTMKRRVRNTTTLDAIKAMRRGDREAEREMLGPGFHATTQIYKSRKTYSRKTKHKTDW